MKKINKSVARTVRPKLHKFKKSRNEQSFRLKAKKSFVVPEVAFRERENLRVLDTENFKEIPHCYHGNFSMFNYEI